MAPLAPWQEAGTGVSVEDLSSQHGFSKATFYKWKAKYGGISVSEVKRMKELEEENPAYRKCMRT